MRSKAISLCALLLLSMILIILPVEVQAQTTIYSTQTGDWKDTATWLGGVVPGTTDTATMCDGHTVTLDDNRTVKIIQINNTATLQIGDSTPAWNVTLTFDDASGSGFVSTSAGTLKVSGSATYYGMNITSENTPPTNYWSGDMSSGDPDITMDYATLTYGTLLWSEGTISIENTTMDYFKTGAWSFRADTGVNTVAFNNVTISNTQYGMRVVQRHDYFYNVVISSVSSTHVSPVSSRLEFTNSNFDLSKTTITEGRIISVHHNDVANDWKIRMNTFAHPLSTVTHKFGSGDNVELLKGKFIVDEAAAAKTIQTESGTTWVLGKDTADASITLTFDDSSAAGFVVDECDGNFYANGTATYPHIIRAANLPATTGWKGWKSDWPNVGAITEVHNTTMYNTRAWSTGHEALAKYSNVTFDMKGVDCACTGAFIIWEPTSGSFFNDISVNGTIGNTEHDIYMMPDSSHIFLKNFVTTNHTGVDYLIEIDEGTTGEVVHFRNSNFDETDFDFWGGGEECHWISQDHNDTSGRYLTGVHAGFNTSKSYVASGWDFGASDTVELLEGVLTIDENADATSFFIEETDAGIEVLATYTFDLTTNLTNNGTLINNGTITDSGDYFDFYNTGSIWLNNSTVSKAKLAYWNGGFNLSLGINSNSTINDWTLESPVDAQFNITYYDFSNKGSGVIWHLNATASSGTIKICTTNLTSGETYRSYVDLVQHTEGTASGDAYNFTVSMSTKHIYLTWVVSGPPVPPDIPGAGIMTGIGAVFQYIIISENTVEFRAEVLGFSEGRDIPVTYYWLFSDNTTSNEKNPTKSFEYGGITANANATLIVCNDKYCSHPVEKSVHLIRWWIIALILAAIITPIILGAWQLDRKYR